ncbi:MAG: bi-domain-containing oxidoreductase [Alphaproteobacteria bacterium]|nr:bi-domain-containing oxidoreductase [Alphaproteobacteria bacterium]
MKQIVQNISNGRTELVTVPAPVCGPHEVLIRVYSSLISAGTEKMLINFGRSSLISKARSQPERVAQVVSKIKSDGILATYDSVASKLSQPIPLGYSNAGIIVEVGSKVQNFAVGDRVCSNGKHAEFVAVSANLCAKIPNSVTYEEASFASIASIALQSVRLANVNIGDRVAIIGLGLIGLLTAQILRAQGCQIVGIDFDKTRLDQCKSYGAATFTAEQADLVLQSLAFTEQRGFDAVIIAATTVSNDPVSLAAQISRQRGKVILVGVVGLELNRDEFYKKELSFQVSCSYGPGRYDLNYEQLGQDYPFGFVRWTAQRNFTAIIELIRDGKLDVNSLVSHSFDLNYFDQAYNLIVTSSSALAVILNYDSEQSYSQIVTNKTEEQSGRYSIQSPTIAIVGAGNYSSRVLSEAFAQTKAGINYVSSASGLSSYLLARKLGAQNATTGIETIVKDDSVNAVVIATRHSQHFSNIMSALDYNKNIFVEKPLCLTLQELESIELRKALLPALIVMVGFNRRFSPFSTKLKQWLSNYSAPMAVVITVNAGFLPMEHWAQDPEVGGGRIIGEACHFIDLMRFFIGHSITSVYAQGSKISTANVDSHDTVSITLQFKDGSHGVIHYFANGHRSFPKERVEVFISGQIFVIDNFRKLKAYGNRIFRTYSKFRQDKGQTPCVQKFIESLENGSVSPIPFDEICEVTRVTIEADRQIRNNS